MEPVTAYFVDTTPSSRVTFMSRSGPTAPLTSARIAVAPAGSENGFDNRSAAEPSSARAHALTVHPAAVRSDTRMRSSSLAPPASALFTASASSTTITPTRPLPSSRMRTVTVVSALHALRRTAKANATRSRRASLLLDGR